MGMPDVVGKPQERRVLSGVFWELVAGVRPLTVKLVAPPVPTADDFMAAHPSIGYDPTITLPCVLVIEVVMVTLTP